LIGKPRGTVDDAAAAPAAAVLGLHVKAIARRWQVHTQASADSPTPSVRRVSDTGNRAIGSGVVVAGAVVLQFARRLERLKWPLAGFGKRE
jgi:hypothetical protein